MKIIIIARLKTVIVIIMKLIIKLAPELTIKSKPVRKRFIQQLRQNLKIICQRVDPGVQVSGQWDNIQLETSENLVYDGKQQLIELIKCTPGISHFFEAQEYPMLTMDDILEKALPVFAPQLDGKTFCLRVKRVGNHDFTSIEVERYVGGGLNQNSNATGVSVSNPDVTVKIEIRHNIFFLVEQRHEGQGGFPIGSQDTTVTLMSGGFDSTVAAYLMMKRGIRTHFLFFNLGGQTHEVGVKQVTKFIWDKFGSSHRVRFISVPFDPLVQEILTKVENSQMGVVLKRIMYRAAERVADQLGLDSFVTGEAIAQVSSQTMANLNVIDQVTDKMVLRPLIVTDKLDIINMARDIGTAPFAEVMPEFCGVISNKPTTRAKIDRIEQEESKIDWQIFEDALDSAEIINIDKVTDQQVSEIAWVSEIGESSVVIDVRHPDEIDLKACPVSDETLEIPFYSVRSKFSDLDQNKNYILYCDKGVMSQMQAQYLKADGFKNVFVWKN